MAASCIHEEEPETTLGYLRAHQLLQIYQNKYRRGRWSGIDEVRNMSLAGRQFHGDYIRICVSYNLKLPFSFGRWKSIPVTQQVVYRKWIGALEQKSEAENDFVYVTPYGRVYHRSIGCRYLDLTVRTVGCTEVSGMRNKDGSIYYACYCAKNATGSVYITDYGTSYHGKIDCSGLKRTIDKVPLSEVGSRQPCNQCGTKEEDG